MKRKFPITETIFILVFLIIITVVKFDQSTVDRENQASVAWRAEVVKFIERQTAEEAKGMHIVTFNEPRYIIFENGNHGAELWTYITNFDKASDIDGPWYKTNNR